MAEPDARPVMLEVSFEEIVVALAFGCARLPSAWDALKEAGGYPDVLQATVLQRLVDRDMINADLAEAIAAFVADWIGEDA